MCHLVLYALIDNGAANEAILLIAFCKHLPPCTSLPTFVGNCPKKGCGMRVSVCLLVFRSLSVSCLCSLLIIGKASTRGGSPLYVAAHGGHFEVCDKLLQSRADVNQAHSFGQPLPCACAYILTEIPNRIYSSHEQPIVFYWTLDIVSVIIDAT